MSDFEVRRTIYGLMEAGLIEPIREIGTAGQGGAYQSRAEQARKARPEESIEDKRGVVNRLIDRIRSL